MNVIRQWLRNRQGLRDLKEFDRGFAFAADRLLRINSLEAIEQLLADVEYSCMQGNQTQFDYGIERAIEVHLAKHSAHVALEMDTLIVFAKGALLDEQSRTFVIEYAEARKQRTSKR